MYQVASAQLGTKLAWMLLDVDRRLANQAVFFSFYHRRQLIERTLYGEIKQVLCLIISIVFYWKAVFVPSFKFQP